MIVGYVVCFLGLCLLDWRFWWLVLWVGFVRGVKWALWIGCAIHSRVLCLVLFVACAWCVGFAGMV